MPINVYLEAALPSLFLGSDIYLYFTPVYIGLYSSISHGNIFFKFPDP